MRNLAKCMAGFDNQYCKTNRKNLLHDIRLSTKVARINTRCFGFRKGNFTRLRLAGKPVSKPNLTVSALRT